jgi:hypothetical protein
MAKIKKWKIRSGNFPTKKRRENLRTKILKQKKGPEIFP